MRNQGYINERASMYGRDNTQCKPKETTLNPMREREKELKRTEVDFDFSLSDPSSHFAYDSLSHTSWSKVRTFVALLTK